MEVERRRRTLAEQLAASSSPSPNLRDLLKRHHDHPDLNQRPSSPPVSSAATARTLLDVIQDEREEQPQARTSLMALLEEADRSALVEVKEEEEEEKGGKEGSKCCVCMERGKGAAFIPCGHTFCRICSRELWIGRRRCPLCNALIHEVLDIY